MGAKVCIPCKVCLLLQGSIFTCYLQYFATWALYTREKKSATDQTYWLLFCWTGSQGKKKNMQQRERERVCVCVKMCVSWKLSSTITVFADGDYMCYTRHEPVGICAQIIPVSAVKHVIGDLLSVVNKYLLIGALLLWLLSFVQLPVTL